MEFSQSETGHLHGTGIPIVRGDRTLSEAALQERRIVDGLPDSRLAVLYAECIAVGAAWVAARRTEESACKAMNTGVFEMMPWGPISMRVPRYAFADRLFISFAVTRFGNGVKVI